MFTKILICSLLLTAVWVRADDDDDDDDNDSSGYEYRAARPVFSHRKQQIVYSAPQQTYIPPKPVVAPQQTYSAPKQTYIAPKPKPVVAPQPSYTAPQQTYIPPKPQSVVAPQPSYSVPVQSYSAPEPTNAESDEEQQQEEELPLMPFNFGYEVKDDDEGTDFSHKSDSDGQIVNGEYRVALPDGRTQVVKYYVTKEDGYVAQVTYEGEARPWIPQPMAHDEDEDEDSNEVPQATSYQIPQPSYQTPQRLYQANF